MLHTIDPSKNSQPKRWFPYFLLILSAMVIWGCGNSSEKKKLPSDLKSRQDTFTPPVIISDSSLGPLSERFRALERENWQKPEMVISKLGDISSQTVADIGAGTGYFSLRLAQQAKKVIAIDIDQRFLDYIDLSVKDAEENGFLDIETRLTTPDEPSLQPDEADVVFIVNTYHLIADREIYFEKVRKSLKKDGFLFLVDFLYKELPIGPPLDEKLPTDSVAAELKRAGFTDLEIDESSLEFQYIIIAR